MSRSTTNIAAGLLALAMIAGLVIRTSSAVFTAQTENTNNSLEAGTIVLTDNGTTATLTLSNMAPGEFSRRCITVSYDGTLDPEAVKVFSTSSFVTTPAATGPGTAAADMQEQVNLSIEQGTGSSTGAFNSCAGFSASGSFLVQDVPLSTWDASATSYATGDGTWNPTGPGQDRMYRFTLELDETANNDFQGAELSGINFSWATRSTATPGEVP